MAKNILIFSDGTGQAGGISVDENRSNIYKLYRATRVGPDSSINPTEQIAYYDAGLGAKPPSGGTFSTIYRFFHNLISQATGFGLTTNIIDCYEMIVRYWEPGDRIYLFGFSRGAYTVRCLGGVLALCGIPRSEKGKPIKRDSGTARRLAKRAVKRVYQHTTSKNYNQSNERERELLDQRKELADRFREAYESDPNDKSTYPYFIGVFDTVAALAMPGSQFLVKALAIAALLLASLGLSLWPGILSFWGWLWRLTIMGLLAAGAAYLVTHIKWEIGLKRKSKWRLFHLTEAKAKFRDFSLHNNVMYAKHAISIDENRADFERVGWGEKGADRPDEDSKGNKTFEQIWFAGNHSDIGGSYPENESRLSDVALKWMLDAAANAEHPIIINSSVIQLYPAANGIQHDECKRGIQYLTSLTGWTWKKRARKLPVANASLHPSVYDRFAFPGILQYDTVEAYRPSTLKEHVDFKDHADYQKK